MKKHWRSMWTSCITMYFPTKKKFKVNFIMIIDGKFWDSYDKIEWNNKRFDAWKILTGGIWWKKKYKGIK